MVDAKTDFLIYINDMCFEVDFEDNEMVLKAVSNGAYKYIDLCTDEDFKDIV